MSEKKQVEIPSFQNMEETSNRNNPTTRHFGCMIPITWNKHLQPNITLGPHSCLFFGTLILSSILLIWMGYNIATTTKGRQIQISIAIVTSLVFYIYSYIKVGLSNPGIASSSFELQQTSKKHLRYCYPCKIIRPNGTVHCYSCDVCITGYDHHCPWVGKCIGSNNICDFKLFILSVLTTLCTYSVCLFTANQYQQTNAIN